MFTILINAIAEVDSLEFERIAYFKPETRAVPDVDVSLGIKGIKTSFLDDIEDCQNSAFVVYESPNDDMELQDLLVEDPFFPCSLYRRRDEEFVELRYEYPMGSLKIVCYFLTNVENCIWGYEDDDEIITEDVDLDFLWDEGFLTKVK